MDYTKPEITKLEAAAVAIRSEESMIKGPAGHDQSSLTQQSVTAYAADD